MLSPTWVPASSYPPKHLTRLANFLAATRCMRKNLFSNQAQRRKVVGKRRGEKLSKNWRKKTRKQWWHGETICKNLSPPESSPAHPWINRMLAYLSFWDQAAVAPEIMEQMGTYYHKSTSAATNICACPKNRKLCSVIMLQLSANDRPEPRSLFNK